MPLSAFEFQTAAKAPNIAIKTSKNSTAPHHSVSPSKIPSACSTFGHEHQPGHLEDGRGPLELIYSFTV